MTTIEQALPRRLPAPAHVPAAAPASALLLFALLAHLARGELTVRTPAAGSSRSPTGGSHATC